MVSNDNRIQNVINFYTLCNKLKDVVRTGWKDWGVSRDRVESVAEHIYGTQMLAVAIWSEYRYDIDIMRVLSMLALHELEETKIGDLTSFDIDRKSKTILGHNVVEEILKPLLKGDSIKDLIYEFDARLTKEAQFAYFCDKLECDIQCKLYDEEGCVDYHKDLENEARKNECVKQVLEEEKSWSKMWLRFDIDKNKYEGPFLDIAKFVKDNDIKTNKQ